MISVNICAENQVYIHADFSEINNLWILFLLSFFSVKYDRHHRILIIRQCIRFAIVNLLFVSYDAKKLMLLILYICLKIDVNIMHKTMKRMCLSSFLSSFWQPYYFVVAIEIFDRHIFSYHHIFHQIWRTSSDAIWSVKPLNLQLFSFLFASHY